MNRLILTATLAMSGLIAPSLRGDVIYMITAANGATATADFAFGTNSVTITLKDTTVNPNDVSFNLSAIQFGLTGGSGASLTSSSGQLVTVAGGGGVPTLGSTVSTGWLLSTGANLYTLDDLGGGAGPAHTIIGLPAAGGNYTNANGSIAGNGPHNPFLDETATFNLSITGVNASTTLSGVSFQFGTTDGVFQTGDPSNPTPEPISVVLVGGGLLGLGLIRRRQGIRGYRTQG